LVSEERAYSPGDYSPSRRKDNTKSTPADIKPAVTVTVTTSGEILYI